jgi:citrate lyase beta subunit
MEADLRSQCQQGKEMGFDGKSLIHPKQVEIVNNVWAPNPEAIDHASRVIACYTEAMQQGKGVAVLDGKLIEALHVDQAKALLLMAHAIEAKNGA